MAWMRGSSTCSTSHCLAARVRTPARGTPAPFALSLSKGLLAWHDGFDKLSPNGEVNPFQPERWDSARTGRIGSNEE